VRSGVAEHALHFGLRHAGLELVHEVLRDVVALLDVDLVDAAADGERERRRR
jgi:hypothetical protein